MTAHNQIRGTGSLTVTGGGTVNLTNHHTYGGATTIAGGTLKLGASATLPVAAGAVWLDATDGSTLVSGGGGVTTWMNKGTLGAGGNATAVAGQEPSIVASEPAMNNQPVVRFDAATGGLAPFDRLTTGPETNFRDRNVTVMYAGRLNGGENQRLLAGVNNNWLLGTWGPGGGSERAYFETNWVTQGVGYDTNTRIYTGTINAGGEGTFFVNGANKGTAANMFGPNGLSLGGGYNGAPTTEYSDGDIGELHVFAGVLSTDDRRAVEAYLARKWQGGNTNVLPATTSVSLTTPTSILDINGVNQTVASTTGVAGSQILNPTGGVFATGGDNTGTTFAGSITGAGVVMKTGSGRWNLSGTNNTGAIITTGGTLAINGTTTLTSLSIGAGATLGGSGTIQSNGGSAVFAAGAYLSPGNSPGTLTVDLNGGTFDISAMTAATGSASLVFELGSPSDQVVLTDSILSIGTNLEFDDFVFTGGAGFTPGVYTLFNGDSTVSGSLGSNLNGTVGGFPSVLSLANGNQDVVLNVIPEPGSALLLGAGGLLLLRRRARRDPA